MFWKILLLFSYSFIAYGILINAQVWLRINFYLRKKHSKTALKKNKNWIDRKFYWKYRKEIPLFWFLYNAFIKIYTWAFPIVGSLFFVKTEEIFASYLKIVSEPVRYFAVTVYLLESIFAEKD